MQKSRQGPLNCPINQTTHVFDGIMLTNFDGSILNGYQPSIIRPVDSTDYANGDEECRRPCYTSSKHQQWCNEENAIKYHAMRPLLTSNDYNSLLKVLFSKIVDENPALLNELNACKLVPKLYCENRILDKEELIEPIMKWVMGKVALGVSQMPEFQKNSTWGSEQFNYTDVQLYVFDVLKDNAFTKDTVYKLIFNLYNPLRSTATLVDVVIIQPFRQGYILAKMGFVNSSEWSQTDTTLPEIMQGYNLPRTDGKYEMVVESPFLPSPDHLGWNYANTLHKKQFNKFGFYDKETNIDIKGGVPESLKQAIRDVDSSAQHKMLPSCGEYKFTGENTKNEFVYGRNVSKNLKNNPSFVFDQKNHTQNQYMQHQTKNINNLNLNPYAYVN